MAKAKKTIRARPLGDKMALRKALWQAIKRAEDIMMDPDESAESVLSAINALNQAAHSYYRVAEAEALLDRVEELEARGGVSPLEQYEVSSN